MRRVGHVTRTAQGLAILRAPDDDVVDIGTMVLNDSLETVGRVVDVFGPVERPYLAVTPEDSVHTPALVGSTLYAR
ncbi:H/ACA ribonucleoprotein complex subunit GAR1 [Natrononativus amylolyticus]|uniref:H/ACA ribonucleoprotein complex subunit GAR1 n=1 Tax=Natrononativus amylolyticus TaxID=2963434 RepID=UPI0020CEDFD9|nr:Gar1/Naf1 family protein [Natrononativus amylolyticus]